MLATDPALAGVSGVYFDQCKRADVAALANDTALQDRLWQVSADLVGVAC
jgi:hypothetical protein